MAQDSDKQKNLQLGVDKGLIEMFLKMTPEERVRSNDNTIRALVELRNGFKKQKTSKRESKDPKDLYRLQILEETLRQISKKTEDDE